VARGYALAALGTDTAGSIRIPAAFCGVVGFKPSRDAISRRGILPLAPSMDCVGAIARTAACCALLHGVLTQSSPPPDTTNFANVRAVAPLGWLTDELHEDIAADFERALAALARAGVHLDRHRFATAPILDEIDSLGGLIAPEAAAILARVPPHRTALVDPLIRARLEEAALIPPDQHRRATALRERAMSEFDGEIGSADILLAPTTGFPPPLLHELTELNAFKHHNRRVLRNTLPANVLDLPAITLPMHGPGSPPSGLMLMGRRCADRRLLSIAQAAERALCRNGV
jgi:aspartyl-tRNA(Asn)/glutamyl-tRNA(Gln) amidotransferase subunit A